MSYRIYKSKYTGQEIDDLLGQVSSKVDDSMLGAAGGVATLDTSGKIPSQQMPENVAYTNKENIFTERQRIVTPYDSDINTQEEGFIDAGIINVSRIKYTDDTKQYYTDNDAILNARYLQLKQQIKNENGLTQHIIQLDHDGIKQVDYDNNSNTNYGYIFPKTYPNKNVTLATIEDLTAQFGALNIQNGTGTKSVEQVINNGTTTTIPISTKNPNAVSLGAPTSVNVGAVGESASSFGGASNATGKRSHSEGTNTVAIGKYSHAEGDNSVALGNDSHAEGITTVAKGQASHSEGSATQSIGYSSHAEGIKTITEGNYSHSEGNETIAHGSASHSEGTLSTANGDNSHAEGRSTHSNGTNSHSEGYETTASGIASHAEGIETNANAYASHTEGEKTVVETQLPSSSGSGSGGSSGGSTGNPDDPSWNIEEHLGEKSHAEGTGNTVYGHSAHAEGFKTTAFGHISHTEGTKTQTGENANGSINGGYSAHAEGSETKAIGYASHAEGVRTEAQGKGSHSEGYGTTASGEYAHTEGTSNTSSGTNSHTEGRDTRASGENSHAEGFGTRATHDNQHVGGRFNADNPDALYIVGNGESDTDRKNAFETLKDGRAKVQSAPKDNNDVVRKLELDTKLDKAGGTISGSLIIAENLTVQGKTTSVDTQNLKVADKLIYVAKDNTVALTSPAGLITPKYDGTNNGGIVYDHTGTAYVGDITLDSNGNVDVDNSDLQPIATRDTTITDGNIVEWDNTNKTLVDSGKAVDNLSTATNLENGTGQDSIVQKYIVNGTDYSAKASGINSIALGGKRYDKLNDTKQTSTSAEGNQSFAAGGSVHTHGDFAIALGKDTDAYQRASLTAGGGTKAGFTEDEFNAYYWDSTNNVPLHGGQGKNENGEILDWDGKTYSKSYSFAAALGEINYVYGRAAFSSGFRNRVYGKYAGTFGNSNKVNGDNSITGGYNNIVDSWSSIVVGGDNKVSGTYSNVSGTKNTVTNGTSVLVSGNRNNIYDVENSAAIGQLNEIKSNQSFAANYHNYIGTRCFDSAVFGTENTVQDGHANAFVAGKGNKTASYSQSIFGTYNVPNASAVFQIGYGWGEADNERKTAFEVLRSGKVKVKNAPQDSDDVVRKLELDNLNARYVSTSILGG